MVFAIFHEIDIFEKNVKKSPFVVHFGKDFGSKIAQKSIKMGSVKNVFFNVVFSAIFRVFKRFWLHLGRPWALQNHSKNWKNREKMPSWRLLASEAHF